MGVPVYPCRALAGNAVHVIILMIFVYVEKSFLLTRSEEKGQIHALRYGLFIGKPRERQVFYWIERNEWIEKYEHIKYKFPLTVKRFELLRKLEHRVSKWRRC